MTTSDDVRWRDGRGTLPSGQAVFDPRGRVDAAPASLADRPSTLAALRVGVLDNSKWNASKLLRATVAQLEATHGIGTATLYRKPSFSRPAPEPLVQQIAGEVDVVVTAIGD